MNHLHVGSPLPKACLCRGNGWSWSKGRALDFFSATNRTPTSDPSISNQFASPERNVSGGEQNQEKLLALEHVERSLDFQFGAGCGNIDEKAASPPRAIDTHDVDGICLRTRRTRSAFRSPHAIRMASLPGKGGAAGNQHAVTLHHQSVDREARRAAGKRSRSENRMHRQCHHRARRQCAASSRLIENRAPAISRKRSVNAMSPFQAAPVSVSLRRRLFRHGKLMLLA